MPVSALQQKTHGTSGAIADSSRGVAVLRMTQAEFDKLTGKAKGQRGKPAGEPTDKPRGVKNAGATKEDFDKWEMTEKYNPRTKFREYGVREKKRRA
jgi:hypothetical protein